MNTTNLNTESQSLVNEKLNALSPEDRAKIKAVIFTGNMNKEEVDAGLASFSPEERAGILIIDAPMPETYEIRKPNRSLIMPVLTYEYKNATPPISFRINSGNRGGRHLTGDHVEGSSTGKPWRAPKKLYRNSPCICGSGKKYKHCKLKGLCGEIKNA